MAVMALLLGASGAPYSETRQRDPQSAADVLRSRGHEVYLGIPGVKA